MTLSSQRILVTGGSGFIGTNLVNHLLDLGHAVLSLDRLPPKIEAHRECWKQVDLLDLDRLCELVRAFQPNYVVHLAARTDLDGKTLKDYESNTAGTRNLMEALEGLPVQHAVFTSTMLVCRPGYIPIHDTDYLPGTVYGESKVMMEKMIRSAQIPYRWTLIRPTSIWGPWFGTPYRDFFDRILAGRMFHIGGVKSATKTYGFVLNAVHQITAILFSSIPAGSVFYIGDEPALNIRQWANEISSHLGKPGPAVLPYPLVRSAAFIGDVLSGIGLSFPMTSFRLNNMTTDNILPLANTLEVGGENPYDMTRAIKITLDWIKKNH